MRISRRTRRVLTIALAVSALVLTPAVSAEANPTPTVRALQEFAGNSANPLQKRIDAQLRLSQGGVQISRNEIAWDNGRVIMAFPLDGTRVAPQPSPAALALTAAFAPAARDRQSSGPMPNSNHGCPTVITGNDWYCFYQDINWGGRRLQWSDQYCGYYESFSPYGFTNQTSSWVNGGGMYVDAGNYGTFNGQVQWYALWVEYDHSSSSWVGSSLNDRADGFQAC